MPPLDGPRLGLMTHLAGAGDPARILREHLELLVIAEQLGFHSVWLAQHHVRAENGHLPSPFVFLAALAQRTTRLRLGTGIVMMPLEDPVRVAEDAAVLDLLSEGRLELGLGVGTDPASYAALGQDFETRRTRHRENRDRLTALLDGKPAAGGIPLHPLSPGLERRIWWATGSEDSAHAAGAEGRGILLGRSSPQTGVRPDGPQSAVIRAYRGGLATSGEAPRIGVSRTIYPTESRAEALSVLEAGTRTWSERMLQNDAWRSLDTDGLLAYHNIHWGPAGQIAERLASDTALAQATDILVQLQPGEPNFAQTVRALTTIALDIAPSLGWQRTAA